MKFLTVNLLTPDGHDVATIEIPPFIQLPDVLVWGVRTFRHHEDNNYVECFTYWIPESVKPEDNREHKIIEFRRTALDTQPIEDLDRASDMIDAEIEEIHEQEANLREHHEKANPTVDAE